MSNGNARTRARIRGFDVVAGTWMDQVTRTHGTDSTLLLWGRRPTTRRPGR